MSLFMTGAAKWTMHYPIECGRNIVTDNIDVEIGPRIQAPDSGGQVVAGRGSWPWLASLGRY